MAKVDDMIPFLDGVTTRLSEALGKLEGLRPVLQLPKLDYAPHIEAIARQKQTASEDFTIAFVGMFNSGKSTIINSLLGLSGDDRLSERDNPDTAKSIRLCYKTSDMSHNAVLVLDNGTREHTTWETAKKYTSQVFLDENPHLKAKADSVVEVVYYINHPMLRVCNILDLPGTGTKNWKTHTRTTHSRLREAEVVFWVIGTCAPEPSSSDLNDLRILCDIKANVTPLINVWSDEEDGIAGVVTAEEMEQAIRRYLGTYFSQTTDILKYYAREIDKAKQQGKEINSLWGLEIFSEFLTKNFLGNFAAQHKEKVRRLTQSVRSSLEKIVSLAFDEQTSIAKIDAECSEENSNLVQLRVDRTDLRFELSGQLRSLASTSAEEIIQSCIGAAKTFIDDKMVMSNWEVMVRAIKTRDSKKVADELAEDFRCNYLNLNKKPNWLTRCLEDYLAQARIIVDARWRRFLLDFGQTSQQADTDYDIPFDFVDNILGKVISGVFAKLVEFILGAGAVAVLIFAIPGGQILDAAALLGVLLSAIFVDPLAGHRKNAKVRASIMIANQRYDFRLKITEAGMELHNACDKAFEGLLNDRGLKLTTKKENLKAAAEVVKMVIDLCQRYQDDLVEMEKGE